MKVKLHTQVNQTGGNPVIWEDINMTLQEILTSLGLDEDKIKSINDAVTTLIASKTQELKDQLQPYLDKDATDEINKIMDELNVAEEHREDLRVLSKMDEAEDKKAAVKEALDKRPHMLAKKEDEEADKSDEESKDDEAKKEEAAKKTADPAVEKETEEETPKETEKKEEESSILKKAFQGNK